MSQRKGDVLVVDQCEEVLAPEVDPAERAAFLAALADIAGRGPLILTLRADRLGEVSRYPAFAHLVERGLHLLGPMETDALRRAIEGPAEQAGPAAGAGSGRPARPRGRGRPRGPAAAVPRAAPDVDQARGEHPDRGRLHGHRRHPGGGVAVGRDRVPRR